MTTKLDKATSDKVAFLSFIVPEFAKLFKIKKLKING
jgi:hypothetical protein